MVGAASLRPETRDFRPRREFLPLPRLPALDCVALPAFFHPTEPEPSKYEPFYLTKPASENSTRNERRGSYSNVIVPRHSLVPYRFWRVWKRGFSLSWPVMAEQILRTLIRTTDLIVAGILSPAAVVAVGLTDIDA